MEGNSSSDSFSSAAANSGDTSSRMLNRTISFSETNENSADTKCGAASVTSGTMETSREKLKFELRDSYFGEVSTSASENRESMDVPPSSSSLAKSSNIQTRTTSGATHHFQYDTNLSPPRRGPGRPRKDGSTGSSMRGKTNSTRARGSGRARIKSQLTFMSSRGGAITAQHRISGASSSTSSGSGHSSSPITLGLGHGSGELGQTTEDLNQTNNTQKCVFCYLTASSRLGQGELLRHDPTPGCTISNSSPSSSTSVAKDTSSVVNEDSSADVAGVATESLQIRINLKHSKVVRPKRKADVQEEQEFSDEIDKIGLPDDIEASDLFEPSGHCLAHHCCASWSDGVVQSDNFALLHVDNAAAAAMMQKCAGCGRRGASITCRAEKCGKKYHYPCASSYGGFQDIKTLAFLCREHLDKIGSLADTDATCSKCETVGDTSSFLFCTSCGQHYHATCLEPLVGTELTVRAGWQCPDCKMCQHCQRYGDDSRMLVCDVCDKGYHVYCMQPPMTTIPKNGWKCKNCRWCTDCGSRTPGSGQSSRWHRNYSVCDSCYQQRNKGLACPLCEKAYRHLKLKSMKQCSSCKRHVHMECIRNASTATEPISESADYICPACLSAENFPQSDAAEGLLWQRQHSSAAPSFRDTMTPSSSLSADENEEAETEYLAKFMKHEMAGGESLSGTDSPFPDLDVNFDMDVDNVLHLLEHDDAGELSGDFPFVPTSEKRSRGGAAASLKKQAGMPRKRISSYRTSSNSSNTRAKNPSSSAQHPRGIGDKRRVSKSGGRGGRSGVNALQSTLQNMISNHNCGNNSRKKDDDEYIHTVIVSSNDDFVFSQDVCVICGSFGKGEEGHFIACMQCGQCYHAYCANVTVNAAIVRRGWRCLDCTFCEGCGRGDDEQHLLLCDDCDVSFHTYCLDPALESIPAGAWLCKWCSSCYVCGDSLPADGRDTKICKRCDSMVTCPMCRSSYNENDVVIMCETCERWCHCKCNGLNSEEAIDKAADKGFKCWFCRPNAPSAGEDGRTSSASGKIVDSALHAVIDGVGLTKAGVRTVQSRPRRGGRPLPSAAPASSAHVAPMSALDDVIDSVHAFVTRGLDELNTSAVDDQMVEDRPEALDGERISVDVSTAGDHGQIDSGLFSPGERKKFSRQKRWMKVGVGGFIVRSRQRSVNEKAEEPIDILDAIAGGEQMQDQAAAGVDGDAQTFGKPKRRKRQFKKQAKMQLEDNYPTYIQDAFFGATQTDGRAAVPKLATTISAINLDDQRSPLANVKAIGDNELEIVAPPAKGPEKRASSAHRRSEFHGDHSTHHTSLGGPSSAGNSRRASACVAQEPMGESYEDLAETDDIFPQSMSIDLQQHEFSNVINILMQGDLDPFGHGDDDRRPSPNLENLIDSRDYIGIGEVDSAEMDLLLDNMLADELHGTDTSRQTSTYGQHSQALIQNNAPPQSTVSYQQNSFGQQLPSQQSSHHVQSMDATHQAQSIETAPQGGPYATHAIAQLQPQQQITQQVPDFAHDPSRFFNTPHPPSTPSQQPVRPLDMPPPSAANVCPETASPRGDGTCAGDGKSYIDRWEPDENLGDKATIAAVLYANMNFPDLRMQHPSWADRAKQIAKLWRLLATEARQQFVQMARENRSACRQLIKAKKSVFEPPGKQRSLSVSSGAGCDQASFTTPRGPQSHQVPNISPDHPSDLTPSPHGSGSSPFGSYTPVSTSPVVHTHQPVTQVASTSDEFKMPQTPFPGLMRSSSLDAGATTPKQEYPKMPAAYAPENTYIKSETFTAAETAPDQGGQIAPNEPISATGHPYHYGVPPASAPHQHAPMDQRPFPPYQGPPNMDWNRCRPPNVMGDFMDPERRGQAHSPRQPPPQSPHMQHQMNVLNAPRQWPDNSHGMPAGGFGPTPMNIGPPQAADALISPRDRQHEEWLGRMQHEYDAQIKTVETELNQLRRSKKNVAAKQRQLKKNGVEPSMEDSSFMTKLTQDIGDRQKHLDQLRKRAKQHNSTVQEYNVKHGLAPPPATTVLPASGPPMVSPTTARPPMEANYPAAGPPPEFYSQPIFDRPPMTPRGMDLAKTPRVHLADTNPFSDNFIPPREPYMMQQPRRPGPGPVVMGQTAPQPTPYPATPGMRFPQPPQQQIMQGASFPGSVYANASPAQSVQQTSPVTNADNAKTEQKKKKKYYGKKSADSASVSTSSLGGKEKMDSSNSASNRIDEDNGPVSAANLLKMAPSFDVDIVHTVFNLMEQVAVNVDGPSASGSERENVLLKRLLGDQQSPGLTDCDDGGGKRSKQKETQPGKRSNSAMSGPSSPKKRQRKVMNKTKPVAPNVSAADSRSIFLEQLNIQLKNLPALTIQEPAPRTDSLISNVLGVTSLVQRQDKPLLAGSGAGHMRLNFVGDYYKDIFGKAPRQQFPNSQGSFGHPYMHMQYATGNTAVRQHLSALPQPPMPEFGAAGGAFPFGAPHLVNVNRFGPPNASPYFHPMAPPPPPGVYKQEFAPMETEARALTESPLDVVYGDAPDAEEDLLPMYPALKPILPAEGRLSPNFRLVAPVPMRAVPADPPPPFDRQASVTTTARPNQAHNDEDDMVSVTLTLDADAAHRVQEVLRGLAALLQIEVPKHYDVHIDTPPQTPEKNLPKEQMDAQSVVICHQCDTAVQQASVRKKLAELGLTPKEDDVDEVIFCSVRCYNQFASTVKAPAVRELEKKVTERHDGHSDSLNGRQASTDPIECIGSMDAALEATTQKSMAIEDSRLDEIINSVLVDVRIVCGSGSGTREEIIHVKDLPKLKESVGVDGDAVSKIKAYEKRWKDTKWKPWKNLDASKVLTAVGRDLNAMYEEISKLLYRPPSLSADNRVCDFCTLQGDGPTDSCGRLLNLDAGRWVHVNCALWSPEVYERIEGALVNVEQAVRRATSAVCSHCQRFGASVPCYKLRCERNYHLTCAVECHCTFLKDKTMLCPNHSAGTGNELILPNLAVIRKVYIERDENRIIAKLYQQGDSGELALRVGSLIFGHIGQLLPHQLRGFHNKDFIYPIGYSAKRIYWSANNPRQRTTYLCAINEKDGGPQFNVTFKDGTRDVTFSEPSASDAWLGVVQPLEQMRVQSGMLKLFLNFLRGEILFGLTESCVVKMIESLPGVDMMLSYECKYGRSPLIDLPLAVNPSGCARCEPHFRTYLKRPHTLTAASSSSLQNLLALSGLSMDMAFYQYGTNRQTLVSKWSQYRKMKQDWQNSVYLARSKIQGLGLYAKRDIEMNAMVIEYIGEVIRNEVAERREKQYQAHNRGIYMFRIDTERVIDATMSGGPARYVNHSCDPNCVAELFEFDREAKIIIMSCRPITKGEELTYDYQFDVEDDSSKIPCLCGAPNCKKWMN